jgi:hypothetical protein
MGELTANRGLLCSLRCPAQRLGVPPSPGVQKTSSISAAQLTAPCPYPFDLPPSRSVTVPVEAEAWHDDRTRVRKDDGRRRSGIGRWPRIGRRRRRHTGCCRPRGRRWPRPTRRSWARWRRVRVPSRRTRSRAHARDAQDRQFLEFLVRNYCAGPLTGIIDAASKQDNPAPSGH